MSERATAFAPASIGNVAVGFDMLGLAIDGVGDTVTAMRVAEPGVAIGKVLDVDGAPHRHLARDAQHNTASIAAQVLWDKHGDVGGVSLDIHKGVPLQSGMGSSAASAVAAVVAVNALLNKPLAVEVLLPYALAGEQYASKGRHVDNIAPSLLGGLILCPLALLPDVVRLQRPTGVSTVLLHPALQVNTAQARQSLAADYPLQLWLEQQGCLAGFVAACASNDSELLRRTLRDVVIEPQRSAAVPCFAAVMQAARQAGAYGSSLSGSGPSMFALCADTDANAVAAAMEAACRGHDIECSVWVSGMNAPGAHLLPESRT